MTEGKIAVDLALLLLMCVAISWRPSPAQTAKPPDAEPTALRSSPIRAVCFSVGGLSN